MYESFYQSLDLTRSGISDYQIRNRTIVVPGFSELTRYEPDEVRKNRAARVLQFLERCFSRDVLTFDYYQEWRDHYDKLPKESVVIEIMGSYAGVCVCQAAADLLLRGNPILLNANLILGSKGVDENETLLSEIDERVRRDLGWKNIPYNKDYLDSNNDVVLYSRKNRARD